MKQKKYLVEEIEQNKLINKKYTKVCTTLNYIQHFLILASVFTGCILVSAFSPSLSIPIGITSSAIGLKICTLTPGIKKCKSVSKKKKEEA